MTDLTANDLNMLSRRLSPLAWAIVAEHADRAYRPTHESAIEALHLQAERLEGDEFDAVCEAIVNLHNMEPCWHDDALGLGQFRDGCAGAS